MIRLLERRLGVVDPDAGAVVRGLPTERLEALAEALLDFRGPDDLRDWLARA